MGEGSAVPDDVVDALIRASRALSGITARSLSSANEEVTLAQFRTLQALSSRGSQTVTALAEHLDVHASTMTRMCSRLVTRGLVERAPSSTDRREVVIRLSTTGIQLVDGVLRSRRELCDKIVHRLSEGEQQAVIEALEAFASAAEEHAGPAVPSS
jgi:DNA-binding MarR family transcriptional regulator